MRRLALFPFSADVDAAASDERLRVAGCDLGLLADQYGTPLYLYDRATLDAAVAAYRETLHDCYPGDVGLTYAGKAFLCVALAQWTQLHGLWVDCTGLGELHIALAAGVPREHIVVHGVNKTLPDLNAALSHAGTIVVDNLIELKRLAALAELAGAPMPDIWLRFRPGWAVATHEYTRTGQHESKFGMDHDEIMRAVCFCRERRLPVRGLHFHLGSQFQNLEPVGDALRKSFELLDAVRPDEGWTLCPGGGWAVAYHEDDLPQPSVVSYVRFVAERTRVGCRRHGLPLPRLQLEPGRSLVARAGVAVYRVGTVKEAAGRHWVLLDGGLADNPRPALYGARYSALPIRNPRRPQRVIAWLAGPYCESGDILVEGLPLADVEPGELLAIPVSGAYQLSMSSNYNGARRPAVVWLEEGSARLIQAAETPDDLMRRDRYLFQPHERSV